MRFSKECKTELIEALRKIFDDKDFVLGVLCDLGSDNAFIIWFGRKENSFCLPLFSIDYDILSHFQFVVTVHNANSAP